MLYADLMPILLYFHIFLIHFSKSSDKFNNSFEIFFFDQTSLSFKSNVKYNLSPLSHHFIHLLADRLHSFICWMTICFFNVLQDYICNAIMLAHLLY